MLVLPSRVCYGNDDHPGLEYRKASSWGTWKGLPLQVSDHYHYPEIDIAAVSRSQDGGRTWQRAEPLMGWFDAHGVANGYGGVSACDEPGVAETADGRLLFFARSTVGRIVASSSSDGGARYLGQLQDHRGERRPRRRRADRSRASRHSSDRAAGRRRAAG